MVMFGDIKDDSMYLKPNKTIIKMDSKNDNTMIFNIIDIKDKEKYMLKERLRGKIHSISRRGQIEYNNRLKESRSSSDKTSFIKYQKAMNAARGQIPIPSPADVVKNLPNYEKMIKTFTSNEFKNMNSFEPVYNYFQHLKSKYSI